MFSCADAGTCATFAYLCYRADEGVAEVVDFPGDAVQPGKVHGDIGDDLVGVVRPRRFGRRRQGLGQLSFADPLVQRLQAQPVRVGIIEMLAQAGLVDERDLIELGEVEEEVLHELVQRAVAVRVDENVVLLRASHGDGAALRVQHERREARLPRAAVPRRPNVQLGVRVHEHAPQVAVAPAISAAHVQAHGRPRSHLASSLELVLERLVSAVLLDLARGVADGLPLPSRHRGRLDLRAGPRVQLYVLRPRRRLAERLGQRRPLFLLALSRFARRPLALRLLLRLPLRLRCLRRHARHRS
eukprot:scaffold526_cov230-Pinguiococcus_pyrenoidosus.AAC.10